MRSLPVLPGLSCCFDGEPTWLCGHLHFPLLYQHLPDSYHGPRPPSQYIWDSAAAPTCPSWSRSAGLATSTKALSRPGTHDRVCLVAGRPPACHVTTAQLGPSGPFLPSCCPWRRRAPEQGRTPTCTSCTSCINWRIGNAHSGHCNCPPQT